MASRFAAVVSKKTMVQGGCLSINECWIPAVVEADGTEFMVLCRDDRLFAHYCGIDTKHSRPWRRTNGFFEHLRKIRNHAVDEWIMNKRHQNDPMATDDQHATMSLRERGPMFVQFDVPDVIDVAFPTIVYDGHEYAARNIKMQSTLRRDKNVAVELTPDNIAYIAAAAVSWEPGDDTSTTRGELVEHNINVADYIDDKTRMFWKKSKRYIYGFYKDEAGGWHQRSVTPKWSDDMDKYIKNIEIAEGRLRKKIRCTMIDDSDDGVCESEDDEPRPTSYQQDGAGAMDNTTHEVDAVGAESTVSTHANDAPAPIAIGIKQQSSIQRFFTSSSKA